MQNNTSEPMEPSEQFCPNPAHCARGQKGQGNISIHDRKRQRYRCKRRKQTLSARRGTTLEGRSQPTELIVIVVMLLAYGCPVQAIVKALGWMSEPWLAGEIEQARSHNACRKRSCDQAS